MPYPQKKLIKKKKKNLNLQDPLWVCTCGEQHLPGLDAVCHWGEHEP